MTDLQALAIVVRALVRTNGAALDRQPEMDAWKIVVELAKESQ